MKALLRTTLGAALLWLGLFPTEAHALSPAAYDKVFDKTDLNHDNFLSLDEFLASQAPGARWIDVAWRFNYNDINQDGYLDKLEYPRFPRRQGWAFSVQGAGLHLGGPR
ncbi:MAG: hypothetical protein QM755_00325 [Luteolibacter sp.]